MGNQLATPSSVAGPPDAVTKKTTERGCRGPIQYAASGMKGWRNSMEDCHTLCCNVSVQETELIDHFIFGVYDGHGGAFTALYAGEKFVETLSKREEMKRYAALPVTGSKSREDVTGVELLREALKAAFLDLDEKIAAIQQNRNGLFSFDDGSLSMKTGPKELRKNINGDIVLPPPPSRRDFERSGSTSVVVVVTPSHLICANAGDSRAILRRNSKTLPLSFDHKPSNVPEQERIVAAGGYVKGRRVDGDLAVSRGLGDFSFKNLSELPREKQKIIAQPDIVVYPRDKKHDEFMVLACDGVWDVASNEQCSNFIHDMIAEGETDVGLMCEETLDFCLEKNSRDNMTIVMVTFPGVNMASNSLTKRNVVWARRAKRNALVFEAQAKAAAQKAFGIDFGYPPEKTPVTVVRTGVTKAAA